MLVPQTEDRDAGRLQGGLDNPGGDERRGSATPRLRVSRVECPGVCEQSGAHNTSRGDAPVRPNGQPGEGSALGASVLLPPPHWLRWNGVLTTRGETPIV